MKNRNPHKLTRKQHVYPARSLSRFADLEGDVLVTSLKQKRTFKCKPSDQVFCVHRHWDQRSEDFAKKLFEDPFQELMNASPSRIAIEEASEVVWRFFALWEARSQLATTPLADQTLLGVKGSDNQTWIDQDALEKAGFVPATSSDPVMVRGRFFAWPRIHRHVMTRVRSYRQMKWGIAKSAWGRWIVPDRAPDFPLLPVSPTCCLVAGFRGGSVTPMEYQTISAQLRASADRFVFGTP